jgi:ubiquitin-like protein Pup
MTDRYQAKRRSEEDVEEVDETIETAESEAADIDDLLDEIDSVLEENAEEFVKNYVQKGGQ